MDERIDTSKITRASYAARKAPEFMNLKLVECSQCDVIFAPMPPPSGTIIEAYHQADYDSSVEARQAADTYANALRPHLAGMRLGSAMDVGTGSGAFLSDLSDMGFAEVIGIEPSAAAIAAAEPRVKPWIREGIFREGDFPAGKFDLISCFMALEHVPDPGILVRTFFDVLAPGGKVALVVHDRTGWLNRFLGRRSPIIDIEHLQIFSPPSMEYLLKKAGYTDISIKPFANKYRLAYWMRLLPIPGGLKTALIGAVEKIGLGELPVAMNVGNLFCVATKPE
jgi:SAM-dependent methyltransferase